MPISINLVANDEVKWAAYGPCRVLAAFGFNNQASDRYIQFHLNKETASVDITNGTVPQVKALYCPASTGFSYGTNAFGNDGLWLPELMIGISSTEVNYTALTNTGLDLTVLIETAFPVTSATTVAGGLDAATGDVNGLQVWTDSNGPKKLLRVDFLNGHGATVYPIIQARNAATSTASYLLLKSVANGATAKYHFGPDGAHFEEYSNPNGPVRDGCFISYLGASGNYVDTGTFPLASTDCRIKAIYE